MSMPKASMHKDHFAPAMKHDVRTARQVSPVKAISVAHSVENSSYAHFWFCVLGLYQRHAFASLFLG